MPALKSKTKTFYLTRDIKPFDSYYLTSRIPPIHGISGVYITRNIGTYRRFCTKDWEVTTGIKLKPLVPTKLKITFELL